jgi:hypothetical protein
VWAIDHDLRITSGFRQEEFLDKAFRTAAEADRQLVNNPQSAGIAKALGLDLPELVSDQEAEFDRQRAAQSLDSFQTLLASYVTSDLDQLRTMVRAKSAAYFHRLIPDEDPRGPDAQVAREFWKQMYSTENPTTHGSTIFGSLLLTDYGVIPRVSGMVDPGRSAFTALNAAESSAILLWSLTGIASGQQ